MRCTVIVDASFCSNTGAAGWAAWIAMDGGKKIKHHAVFKVEIKTSSEAEDKAVLNGIHMAIKKGATDILVQSDCMSSVRMVQQNNYPEGFVLPTGVKVVSRHVKGHTRNPDPRYYCNRWCDSMARKRMNQKRKIIFSKEKVNERIREHAKQVVAKGGEVPDILAVISGPRCSTKNSSG